METVEIIALSMGVAWASGINLYAAIFVLGWLGMTGNIVLPEQLQVCSDPMVMAVAGFMYFVEFFADKTPGVDTGWDVIHSFIRIPAGAILAAGAVGEPHREHQREHRDGLGPLHARVPQLWASRSFAIARICISSVPA